MPGDIQHLAHEIKPGLPLALQRPLRFCAYQESGFSPRSPMRQAVCNSHIAA